MTRSLELSLKEAREISLRAQGIGGVLLSPNRIFDFVKWVQIDSISVARKSHELVMLARGSSISQVIEVMSRSSNVSYFEYPAHALCLVPIQLWPLFAFRRRQIRNKGWRGPTVDVKAISAVHAILRGNEFICSSDLGPNEGVGWERSAPLKIAMEWLVWTGEVISSGRSGWKRLYRRASKVVPNELFSKEPSDQECIDELVKLSLDALGVGTLDDVSDYARLPSTIVVKSLERIDACRTEVEGWSVPVWASASVVTTKISESSAPIALSPFDSLVWYRPRLKRLFGRSFILEAYLAPEKRKFGYFMMPVLSGGEVVGRLSPRKRGGSLLIEAAECNSPENHDSIICAAVKLAEWVGAEAIEWKTAIRIEQV